MVCVTFASQSLGSEIFSAGVHKDILIRGSPGGQAEGTQRAARKTLYRSGGESRFRTGE